jgi:hypothetical protein
MEGTAHSRLWAEYLAAEKIDKHDIAFRAAQLLWDQGNQVEAYAWFSQAIEDAHSVGNRRAAAIISEDYAETLSASGRFDDALEVLRYFLAEIEPWMNWEIGLMHRSLAWTFRRIGDVQRYRGQLRAAIHQYEVGELPNWYGPLQNELAHSLISSEEWEDASEIASRGDLWPTGAPNEVVAHRNYILARLALHRRDVPQAKVLLVESFAVLVHSDLDLALEALEFLVTQICLTPEDKLHLVASLPEVTEATEAESQRLIDLINRSDASLF